MQQVPMIDVARLWLACMWVIAGVLKGVQPGAARVYVRRRIGTSDRMATVIIATLSVFEIAIGAALFAGFVVTEAAALAVAALVVFTFIMASSPGEDSGCGCFGALDAAADSRWVVIGRNVAMMSVALFVALGRPLGGAALIREPLTWLFAMTLVWLFGIAYFMGARLLFPPRRGLSEISNIS